CLKGATSCLTSAASRLKANAKVLFGHYERHQSWASPASEDAPEDGVAADDPVAAEFAERLGNILASTYDAKHKLGAGFGGGKQKHGEEQQ
ncbi:unnamed protein product, partial [Amoebophrya sp. A25]